MARTEPKLIQQVFEARYERGYRFFDRCGDVMVILEEALPQFSNKAIWMPEEIAPKGARLKCPELDITLVFDSYRMCLDQNPADVSCDFNGLSEFVLQTIISKFDIRKTIRFGNRLFFMLPCDSIEQAEALSVKSSPAKDWLANALEDLQTQKCEVAITRENKDKAEGMSFSIYPVHKIEAPLQIDKRLTVAPHLLPTGQKEALLSQLKRQKQRAQDPLAGLMIDVDYWWVTPKEMNIKEFQNASSSKVGSILESFLGKKK